MSKSFGTILCVIFIFTGISAYCGFWDSAGDVLNVANKVIDPENAVTDVKLNEIYNLYHENSLAAKNKYSKKWLRFSATFKRLISDSDSKYIIFAEGNGHSVKCFVAKDADSGSLSKLRAGNKVRITGKIIRVADDGRMFFKNCKIK